MEYLLEQQQEALQRALLLHAGIAKSIVGMEGELQHPFENRMPSINHSPPLVWSSLPDEVPPGSFLPNSSWTPQGQAAVCEIETDKKQPSFVQPLLQDVSPMSGQLSRSKGVYAIAHSITRDFQSIRRLEEAMESGEFHVEDLYKKSGFWVSLMKNSLWQKLIFGTILLNTVYIALDTDYNKAEVLSDSQPFFQIMSNIFCTLFSMELVSRLFAFQKLHFALYDLWLVFDAFLVLLLIWETWLQVLVYKWSSGALGGGGGLGFLSILRVFRVFRLIRALRAVPELMILVQGMFAALRSVLATLCLLTLTIYLFSILFTQLLAATNFDPGYFDTVPQSMNHLLIQVLCGADPEFMTKMRDYGFVHYGLWLVFLFLCQLTIMNMLIGVVCNAIDDTTEEIREHVLSKDVTKQIADALSEMNLDECGYFSRGEFIVLMRDPDMLKMFYKHGVDLGGLQEFFDGIYRGVDKLTFADVLDMIMMFRQEKSTTVKDLVVLRRMIQLKIAALEDRVRNLSHGESFSRQSTPWD